MTEISPNLSLPFIMPSQAQKHVTHNEALRMLDSLVQLSVISTQLNNVPLEYSEGDSYIIAENALGDWQGQDLNITSMQDGEWAFFTPKIGWYCYDQSSEVLLTWSGSVWQPHGLQGLATVDSLAVNTDISNTNKLAVKSDSVLFSHDDVTPGNGSMRTTINKASENDVSSVLFQNAYVGHAEMGIVGSNDFQLKTSGDGLAWNTAFSAQASSGNVCFGNISDFSQKVVISGDSPWLRISNATETKVGIELLDAQATSSQMLQISYDCASKVSAWNVNGNQIFEANEDAIIPQVLLNSDEMVCGQYLYSKSRVFISSNAASGGDGPTSDPTLATNLDHIWNNDSTNEWHFCSDTTYKATGNATLRAAAFTTSSDYRLKNDISSLDRDNSVKRIMTINPVTFKWRIEAKIAGEDKVEGFIAHELETAFPSVVLGEKDSVNEHTNEPIYQSVAHERLLPVVISALQHALQKIEMLEEKLG